MKVLLFLFLVPAICVAQREVKPASIVPLTLSAEGERKFNADQEAVRRIGEKLEKGVKEEELTAAEWKLWNEVSDAEGYWDTIGNGCSWYCGGGYDSLYASSSLKAQGANTYGSDNLHDFSLKSAWVEGVKGYGVGEYVEYLFAPDCPRITDIIIANGYVKSEQAYRDNSRVKKLKMYVNGKAFAILDLEDRRSLQRFKFSPMGNGNREDHEVLLKQPAWRLRFEILEVYEGLKYDDVVMAELYFDGIDVH